MVNLRPATPADAPVILRFIRELAHYEREPDAVIATEADLLRDGWSLAPDGTPLSPQVPARFSAVMAELDGECAGFALYFTSYSTWLGRHGIRLEDLYVTPALRGRGIGKALLAHLAQVALEQGCQRLEWDVLTWNEPAIAVYERLGAVTQTEWRIMRVTGEALRSLAAANEVP
ncbi:MAG TPA: GNAT family N-acetyltransferase [Acidobacteriaceae bacterium]|jgi:GNAT superfamily N-acetyltransferase